MGLWSPSANSAQDAKHVQGHGTHAWQRDLSELQINYIELKKSPELKRDGNWESTPRGVQQMFVFILALLLLFTTHLLIAAAGSRVLRKANPQSEPPQLFLCGIFFHTQTLFL